MLFEFDGLVDALRGPGIEGSVLGLTAGPSEAGKGASARGADSESGIEDLFVDFVTGRASAEQIAQVFFLISGPARNVSVSEQGKDRYVLTASDFELDGGEPGLLAMLGEMRLTVVYRVGSGLESAELTNLGQYSGMLRLSPLDGAKVEHLFDSARLVGADGTRVCDLSVLGPMLERLRATAGN